MEKIDHVDFVRAISIIGILLCHYFIYGTLDCVGMLGRFLAGTFNIVFFCLSALLFGLRWKRTGKTPFPLRRFMSKRIVRLASSYWPCLILVFAGFMIFGVKFGLKEVILNTFFLAWFSKMPGVGHFWFVTMIIFCYFSFVILSKYHIFRKLYVEGYFAALIFICCLIEYGMDRMKLPGFMIGVLLITGYVFINASKILFIAAKRKL